MCVAFRAMTRSVELKEHAQGPEGSPTAFDGIVASDGSVRKIDGMPEVDRDIYFPGEAVIDEHRVPADSFEQANARFGLVGLPSSDHA